MTTIEPESELKKTININADVYDSLKLHCESEGYKVKWLVEQLILNYLNKEQGKHMTNIDIYAKTFIETFDKKFSTAFSVIGNATDDGPNDFISNDLGVGMYRWGYAFVPTNHPKNIIKMAIEQAKQGFDSFLKNIKPNIIPDGQQILLSNEVHDWMHGNAIKSTTGINFYVEDAPAMNVGLLHRGVVIIAAIKIQVL